MENLLFFADGEISVQNSEEDLQRLLFILTISTKAFVRKISNQFTIQALKSITL